MTRDSTLAEITRSYNRLVVRYHPDKNPGNEEALQKFKDVTEAFEVLSDTDKRAVYDRGPSSEAFFRASANQGSAYGKRESRPESGFHDPLGIGAELNRRLNFLNDTYTRMRKEKTPAEALIATLRSERSMKRPKILWWGAQVGNEIYESQTHSIFYKFINEIMDDLFYTGEDINAPTEMPLVNGGKEQNALAIRSQSQAMPRLPTLEQIMEINKLHGKKGNYDLTKRAIKEARSEHDLMELFHYSMKSYWAEEYLYYPDKRSQANVWDSRKYIVNSVESTVERLYGTGTPVSEFFVKFTRNRLSQINPTDKKMVNHLIAVLGNIDTPEAHEALQELAAGRKSNRNIRNQALKMLPLMDGQNQRLLLQDSSIKSTSIAVTPSHGEGIDLNQARTQALRERLKGNGDVHEKMRAGIRLFRAGKLINEDIDPLVKAVNEYYARGKIKKIWHAIKPVPVLEQADVEKNAEIRKNAVEVLVRLAPTYPSVHSALASHLRNERFYRSAESIIGYATERKIDDPVLFAGIRDFVQKNRRNDEFAQGDGIDYLARHAKRDDQETLAVLEKIANSKDGRKQYLATAAIKAIKKIERDANSSAALLDPIGIPISDRLDEKDIASLKEILATPSKYDQRTLIEQQFEAANRLHAIDRLDNTDLEKLAIAVKNYFWRYRSRSGDIPEKLIHTLLELFPKIPGVVVPMLVRATEEGWGYPSEEMAKVAMKHNIRDPKLLEAFRRDISSGIEDRFPHRHVIEALGRLGSPSDEALLATLRKKSAFHYSGREPQPESYDSAMALGRMGANDPTTLKHLRSLMREHEAHLTGSGVPYAAALALMGINEPDVLGLLKRELTHNPNGQRDHRAVAIEGLNALQEQGGNFSSAGNFEELNCEPGFRALTNQPKPE